MSKLAQEKLSREAWTIILLFVSVNLISLAFSGFLSHPIPAWVRILEYFLLLVAAFFLILEIRRQIRQKQISSEKQR